MTYEIVARHHWPAFFESFSNQLRGRRVEIEVIGLDLGVQLEAEWVPLRALRFETERRRLAAELAGERIVEHVIENPEAVWVELSGGELQSLVVEDESSRKEIFRFRLPLELPEPTWRGEASP